MVLATNLVAYYKLDETSAGAVVDSTSTNNATNYNATINQTGKIGKAYTFNGSSAYLQSASQSFTGNADYTITAWIYHTSRTNHSNIFTNGVEVTKAGLKFRINDTTGYLSVSLANAAGTNSGEAIPLNTWTFVVLTKLGNTYKLYINNVKKGNDGTITSSNISAAGTQRIGRDIAAGTGYFTGTIDEVGVWTRVLTFAELTELYNSGTGLSYPFTTTNNNFFSLSLGAEF